MDAPVLTSNESQAIYEALYPARNEWFNIGAALGIDNDTLTAIKNTNGESKTCLREMISHLLHTQPSSLTWARFCECLRSCTVERNDVAEKIENYVKEFTSAEDPSKIQTQKRGRLDSDSQLRNELDTIQNKHGELVSSIKESLERRRKQPRQIASYLLCNPSSKAVWESEDSGLALFHCRKELLSAKTIDDLFIAILPFESFLDYDLLEKIVEKFGDKADKENLTQYVTDLKSFLSSWKVKPQNICQYESNTEHELKMCFKLDSDSMKCYRDFKGSIAKIFRVNVCAIHIAAVDIGCIEIGFFFPKVIAKQSLSSSQAAQLGALTPRVLRVSVIDGPSRTVIFEAKPVNDPAHTKTNPEEFQSKRQKMSTISDVSLKLLVACRSKTPDINEIRGYLEQEECDANIREDDDFKWTPFMRCLENKHFEVAKLLLKYQPSVHIQDKKEWSPLVLASRAGDLEIVQGIVELGAEIDKPTNKLWTPLMWAAQEGHARVAEFLLKSGALVDFPDENGWTPLMQASQEGHVDVVNVLLDHGANANHQTDTFWCALMAAAKNKHSEVVDALLRRGAQVDLARDDGSTALQVASYYKGNSAVVNVLIKHGANVDLQNKNGITALMLATNKGHLDLVQALLDGGADINKKQPSTEWSAIFFAARIGNPDVFKELLHRGADTEISHGRTVAKIADHFKHKAILSELNKYQETYKQQISSHLPTSTPVKQADQEHKTSAPEPNAETQLKQQLLVQQPADNKWIMEDDEENKHMLEEFIFGFLKAAFRGSRKGLPSAEEFSYKGDLYEEQLLCS